MISKQKYFWLMALMLILIGSSCETENKIEKLENQSFDVDSFFETLLEKGQGLDSEQVLYIDYTFNSDQKTITIAEIEQKELDFFVLESANARAADYKVTCTVDGKDIWVKECDGKWDCGSLVYDCLNDEGGCGTVCKQQIAYHPASRNFFLLNSGS